MRDEHFGFRILEDRRGSRLGRPWIEADRDPAQLHDREHGGHRIDPEVEEKGDRRLRARALRLERARQLPRTVGEPAVGDPPAAGDDRGLGRLARHPVANASRRSARSPGVRGRKSPVECGEASITAAAARSAARPYCSATGSHVIAAWWEARRGVAVEALDRSEPDAAAPLASNSRFTACTQSRATNALSRR